MDDEAHPSLPCPFSLVAIVSVIPWLQSCQYKDDAHRNWRCYKEQSFINIVKTPGGKPVSAFQWVYSRLIAVIEAAISSADNQGVLQLSKTTFSVSNGTCNNKDLARLAATTATPRFEYMAETWQLLNGDGGRTQRPIQHRFNFPLLPLSSTCTSCSRLV